MNAGKPTLFKTDPEIDPGLTMTGMYNVLKKLRRQRSPGQNPLAPPRILGNL